jgi:hypothetical protein
MLRDVQGLTGPGCLLAIRYGVGKVSGPKAPLVNANAIPEGLAMLPRTQTNSRIPLEELTAQSEDVADRRRRGEMSCAECRRLTSFAFVSAVLLIGFYHLDSRFGATKTSLAKLVW